MSKDASTLVLRNYPDDDALQNPKKYTKAVSFSPDIIPLYGMKADQSTLVHPATWRGYVGMPIIGGDVNNVYVRGHGSGGPYIASLRAFPSELILWPQVWQGPNSVLSSPVVIPGGDADGPYASSSPLQLRPPHSTGHTYSLVASVFKHDPANERKSLKDFEPTPVFDPRTSSVDQLLSFFSEDKHFTFHNIKCCAYVHVVDPTLKHFSTTTRLRIFDKFPVSLTFNIGWHEGTPIPDGVQVSLFDDRGKIAIPRGPLNAGSHMAILEPTYDGILTLNVFAPPGDTNFEPYHGLSLRVSRNEIMKPPQLLGALNIIFEPHATRNLRFASPSATQLRESESKNTTDDNASAPIPVTTPAATGWWFRAQPTDTNNFPHAGPGGYSPDIQPVGTDLTKTAIWNDVQNPAADYSKDNNIELVGGESNYVFVRGHSTIADIDVQSRLFAIVGSAILHPSQYAKQGLVAQVFDGSGGINEQSIAVPNDNQFYIFNRPFDLKAPPNPDPGSTGQPWGTEPHYCLIAEVRQKRKGSPVFPNWSNDQEEDFATLADFQSWCLTCPLVIYRNIGWVPCKPGGETCWEWNCWTQLVIPKCSSLCSFWTIIVDCDSPVIPPNSTWTLKCEDNEIFVPNGMCFENLKINEGGAFTGCHFTGARPGYTSNLFLSVTWCDSAKTVPPPSIKFRLAMTETILSPIQFITAGAAPGSETWPFFVAKQYPYIGNHPNPSPLPSFPASGAGNKWPYPGVPQFVFGQVSLAAKLE